MLWIKKKWKHSLYYADADNRNQQTHFRTEAVQLFTKNVKRWEAVGGIVYNLTDLIIDPQFSFEDKRDNRASKVRVEKCSFFVNLDS